MNTSICKKLTAILLAMVLLVSLCACGGSAATGAEAPQSTASDSVETAAAEETVAAPKAETSAEEIIVDTEAKDQTEVELPLTEEPVSFSLYFSQPGFFNQFLESPADNECVKYLAEITGVSLDFYVVPAETESEQFLIMSAAGNLPELVMNGSNLYAGGGGKAIKDEVFVDLMDYEADMPHYFRFVNDNAEWHTIFTVNEGESVDGVYQINYPLAGTSSGLVIRQDWLDELGLDTPRTYDDYHEVLTAFKSDKGCSAPLLMDPNGDNNVWSYGFGCNAQISDHNELLLQFGEVDGQVVYWPITDGYRDMLSMFANWYQEGLIDKDFYTKTSKMAADDALIGSDASGVWYSSLTNLPVYEELFGNTTTAVPSPIPTRDGTNNDVFQAADNLKDHTCMNITTNCENPELAARFLDFFFSDEGAELANYGKEGYTFEYDADGNPQYTEFITNSDTGFGAELTFVLYGMSSFPSIRKSTNFYDDYCMGAMELWSEIKGGQSACHGISQSVKLTVEEEENVTAQIGDLLTIMRETTFRIICGESDITAFDELVTQAESMGIEDIIAVYQSKLDQ